VELSALAKELTRLDKFSAQAWCAAGNCFSLQKEHENSIKFFNRAIQVSSSTKVDSAGQCCDLDCRRFLPIFCKNGAIL
jgi:hypothetical protein